MFCSGDVHFATLSTNTGWREAQLCNGITCSLVNQLLLSASFGIRLHSELISFYIRWSCSDLWSQLPLGKLFIVFSGGDGSSVRRRTLFLKVMVFCTWEFQPKKSCFWKNVKCTQCCSESIELISSLSLLYSLMSVLLNCFLLPTHGVYQLKCVVLG